TTLKSHCIKRLCALFGVSESAYYARLKRRQAVEKHTALAIEIKVIFEASRHPPASEPFNQV
ncbi:MAG: IS3 family transposase, partial [[Pasteurella] aerogenes]|nr:IS3 family transposase [[Pasteurella] aerogenes]